MCSHLSYSKEKTAATLWLLTPGFLWPYTEGVCSPQGQASRKGLLTKHLSDSLGREERRRVLIAWSLHTQRKAQALKLRPGHRAGGSSQ